MPNSLYWLTQTRRALTSIPAARSTAVRIGPIRLLSLSRGGRPTFRKKRNRNTSTSTRFGFRNMILKTCRHLPAARNELWAGKSQPLRAVTNPTLKSFSFPARLSFTIQTQQSPGSGDSRRVPGIGGEFQGHFSRRDGIRKTSGFGISGGECVDHA